MTTLSGVVAVAILCKCIESILALALKEVYDGFGGRFCRAMWGVCLS